MTRSIRTATAFALAAAGACATTKGSSPSSATASHDMAAMPGHDMSAMGSHSSAEKAFLFPDGDDKGWSKIENGTQHNMAPEVPLAKLAAGDARATAPPARAHDGRHQEVSDGQGRRSRGLSARGAVHSRAGHALRRRTQRPRQRADRRRHSASVDDHLRRQQADVADRRVHVHLERDGGRAGARGLRGPERSLALSHRHLSRARAERRQEALGLRRQHHAGRLQGEDAATGWRRRSICCTYGRCPATRIRSASSRTRTPLSRAATARTTPTTTTSRTNAKHRDRASRRRARSGRRALRSTRRRADRTWSRRGARAARTTADRRARRPADRPPIGSRSDSDRCGS